MTWHLGALALLSLGADPLPVSQPPETAISACAGSCESARPWQLQLGYRAWFSWGNADDLVGDASLFKFRDTFSTVHEFNIDAAYQRWVARVDLGFGDLGQGRFESEIVPDGSTGITGAIDDDGLFYVTADLGYRIYRRGDLNCRGCAIDLLAGYQFWTENYEPSAAGSILFADRYSWHSVRLGLRGIAAWERLLLQGRIMVSPYAHFASEATSATAPGLDYLIEADGSWGLMSDFSASYRINQNLSVELGYQVNYLDSGPGTFNDLDGFEGARHIRHGLLVGVHWRF